MTDARRPRRPPATPEAAGLPAGIDLAAFARQAKALAELATGQNSDDRGPVPTVAAFAPEALARLTNERTRATYGVHFRRLVECRPCRAPDRRGDPGPPERCLAAACRLVTDDVGDPQVDQDADVLVDVDGTPLTDDAGRPLRPLLHARAGEDNHGRPYRLDTYPVGRMVDIMTWIERKEIAAAKAAFARRVQRERAADGAVATGPLADVDRTDKLKPGAAGVRSFVCAAVNLFAAAVEDGWLEQNPALALRRRQPAKPSTRKRALMPHEVEQVAQVVLLQAADPDLDYLLVWFVSETGARVSSVLRLKLEDLDPYRQTIWLGKKTAFEREHPISTSLLIALLEHADARGAYYDTDPVFWMNDHGKYVPLAETHFRSLWRLVDRHCPWARGIRVSNHSLRKATATRLERMISERVAEAFIGHFHNNSNGPYLRAGLPERALALEVLTGEPHPLAAPNADWLSPAQAAELARRRLDAFGDRA